MNIMKPIMLQLLHLWIVATLTGVIVVVLLGIVAVLDIHSKKWQEQEEE
jgi:ABC-type phosphate/phosphonate transport system permease subunit